MHPFACITLPKSNTSNHRVNLKLQFLNENIEQSSYLGIFGLNSVVESQMLPIWQEQVREGKVDFGHHNSKLKFPFPLISIHFDQTKDVFEHDQHSCYYTGMSLFVSLAVEVFLLFKCFVGFSLITE